MEIIPIRFILHREVMMPGVPNLAEIMDSLTPDEPAASPEPSETNHASEVSVAQQKFLREKLIGKGFNVADDLQDDDQIIDVLTGMVDEANSVLGDEGYHTYNSKKTDFEKWLTDRQAEEAAKANPQPVQAQPSHLTAATVSEEAAFFREHGFITRDENGDWVAKNPTYQQAADEYNKVEAVTRTNILKFSQDPIGFLKTMSKDIVGEGSSQKMQELESVVAELKKKLEDRENREYQTARQDKFRNWVNQNSDKLFVGGDRSRLTEYGRLYADAEAKVREAGVVDSERLHTATLKIVDLIKPQTPVSPALKLKPEVPDLRAEPRQAFLSNRRSGQKLSEFAGKSPAVVAVPKGKAGKPSLAAIIAEAESLR
jgi:hypothetical protein